jgi:hypothetical protein
MYSIKLSKVFTFIIIVYLYWVSFEWIILSDVNSYSQIQHIRNFIDILPMIMVAFIACYYPLKLKMPEFKIFLGFLIIIILSSISLFIEIHNVLPVVSYIGVTFRFVPFIILIKFASQDTYSKFFKHVKIIFWIQVILALLSLINKQKFVAILLPAQTIFGIHSPTTYRDPGISTSFVNTIEFSFLILALTIIYLSLSQSKREKILVSVFSLTLIVFSYSIASIIALIVLLFIISRHKIIFAVGGLAALIIFFWIYGDFFYSLLGMDSIKTWIKISSEYNRVGYFTKLLPEFLTSNLKDILLGIGYDGGAINAQLATYHHIPKAMINNDNNLKYLKDVYWIATLFAQGFLVLIITLGILRTIYITAKRYLIKTNFILIKTFVLMILVLGFFNQVLDVKGFTFCFWIIVSLTMDRATLNTDNT